MLYCSIRNNYKREQSKISEQFGSGTADLIRYGTKNMKFDRFSELWDALVTNRPKPADVEPIPNGMKPTTAEALIAYGMGDKTKVNEIRSKLKRQLAK
jgi:hypothetical protein